jgi:putative colanic acid biosynthesis UDP-glucose lipid carrier transferase
MCDCVPGPAIFSIPASRVVCRAGGHPGLAPNAHDGRGRRVISLAAASARVLLTFRAMPQPASSVIFRKVTSIPVGRDQLVNSLEFLVGPLMLSVSLWAVTWAHNEVLAPRYVILSLLVFSLTFPGPAYLNQPPLRVTRHIVFSWLAISALLYAMGYASGYLGYFDLELLMIWWVVAPLTELAAHFLLRWLTPKIIDLQGPLRRAVVAGMNAQGIELARRLEEDPYSRIRVIGFFDDRVDRVGPEAAYPLLGEVAQLPAFAREQQIEKIYISLPMAAQPRILNLLDELRDTTASIYFVPDMFLTDLIQARMDSVGDLPVVAVCETPFTGLSGLVKRVFDVVMATLILILISPLLLATAVAIRLETPGPVIFRQRRYGLDGKEIIVYKFRSMRVAEDGAVIQQATKDDPRVTRVGRILRRTSIDELPQFVNVLQGRMSIVGPRPHAVAHNETYRKLIKGYMLRHKVKPGITGWAQVNGFRGETNTLEKMSARIDHDLDYLRNWSLRLDMYIIAKTVWVVLIEREKTAY